MRKARFSLSFSCLQFTGLLLTAYTQTGATAVFTELQYNPRWYRTYDSASDILPEKGQLLFNWKFEDAAMQPDSFFVGIDTLWELPQDVGDDTASDWDLQICPDEICLNGLKAGVHGAFSPYPFEAGRFKTEHHFQFFPAIDSKSYDFVAPAGSLMGGLLYCRSRTTGAADTVLGYGAWKMVWDTAHLPPVRPVNGYLPKRSDFVFSGDTVRYMQGQSGIHIDPPAMARSRIKLRVSIEAATIRIAFPEVKSRKGIGIFGLDGKRIWSSGELPADQVQLVLAGHDMGMISQRPGFLLIHLSWPGGEEWSICPYLHQ